MGLILASALAASQVEERRIAFHALNAADLATTLHCLNKVPGCREGNPLYGQDKTKIIIGKVLTSVLYEVGLSKIPDNQKSAYQLISIGVMGSVVVWNCTIIF